jgi:hypothetical protein
MSGIHRYYLVYTSFVVRLVINIIDSNIWNRNIRVAEKRYSKYM